MATLATACHAQSKKEAQLSVLFVKAVAAVVLDIVVHLLVVVVVAVAAGATAVVGRGQGVTEAPPKSAQAAVSLGVPRSVLESQWSRLLPAVHVCHAGSHECVEN